MTIKITKGIVSSCFDANNSTGRMQMATFAVGNPAVNFWSPFSFGDRPFAVGDYIAVAGRRTFIPGIYYVALAYRRLGSGGTAHFLNVGFPGACILLGLVGAFGVLFLGPLNVATKAESAVLLALGAFGIWRLWSMHRACKMLDKLESTLSTYQ
jgi:hypothetical protein